MWCDAPDMPYIRRLGPREKTYLFIRLILRYAVLGPNKWNSDINKR